MTLPDEPSPPEHPPRGLRCAYAWRRFIKPSHDPFAEPDAHNLAVRRSEISCPKITRIITLYQSS